MKIYVATMEALRKDRMKFSLGTYRQNPWFSEFLKIFKELVLTYNHGSQKHINYSRVRIVGSLILILKKKSGPMVLS